MTSPKTLARITGVLYVVGSVGPVFAMVLRSAIVQYRAHAERLWRALCAFAAQPSATRQPGPRERRSESPPAR